MLKPLRVLMVEYSEVTPGVRSVRSGIEEQGDAFKLYE